MQFEKPIWTEGMLLSQQHLQQRDHYYERLFQQYFETLAPLNWGIKKIEVDEDGLQYGCYRILQCQIIFPEGILVHYNSQKEETLSCQLLGKLDEIINIYLCMPNNGWVAGIAGYQSVEENAASWKANYQIVADFFDNGRKKEVLFAKPNLTLSCDDQFALSQFHHIKIAEVKSLGDDSYQLSDHYVPPAINLQASTVLNSLLNKTLDVLAAKIRFIQEQRQRLLENGNEFPYSDFQYSYLLPVLLTGFSQLRHCKHIITHPEKFFSILIQLISNLGSFIDHFQFNELPVYQHRNIGPLFLRLYQLLKRGIEEAMPIQSSIVLLRRESATNYVVENVDRNLLEKYRFYLAVYYESDDINWIKRFCRQIKIASRKDIEDVIASALLGVRIIHMQRLPIKFPVKPHYEYFYLEPSGEFWQHIIKEQNLAIFVSQTFHQAKIELIPIQV